MCFRALHISIANIDFRVADVATDAVLCCFRDRFSRALGQPSAPLGGQVMPRKTKDAVENIYKAAVSCGSRRTRLESQPRVRQMAHPESGADYRSRGRLEPKREADDGHDEEEGSHENHERWRPGKSAKKMIRHSTRCARQGVLSRPGCQQRQQPVLTHPSPCTRAWRTWEAKAVPVMPRASLS
jgi:hypothetical protein